MMLKMIIPNLKDERDACHIVIHVFYLLNHFCCQESVKGSLEHERSQNKGWTRKMTKNVLEADTFCFLSSFKTTLLLVLTN
uniref:Uncharacterized protein n=1 Tax=Rhizophora mucronata TaxID=61149 RepID=A0A2P2N0X9_RHIMU